MRAYTVAATAVALGINSKWVDNALSHNRVPGVLQSKQGIARRVTPQALLVLDVALKLVRSMAVPVPRALETAHRVIAAGEDGIQLPGVTSIHLIADVKALTDDLTIRFERAVEISPTPRRGRPQRK